MCTTIYQFKCGRDKVTVLILIDMSGASDTIGDIIGDITIGDTIGDIIVTNRLSLWHGISGIVFGLTSYISDTYKSTY